MKKFTTQEVTTKRIDMKAEMEIRNSMREYSHDLLNAASAVVNMSEKELVENRANLQRILEQSSIFLENMLIAYENEFNMVQKLCEECDKLNNELLKAGWDITTGEFADWGKEETERE